MVKIYLTLARVEKGGERGDRANKSIATAFIQGRIYGLWLQQDKRYLQGEYDSGL